MKETAIQKLVDTFGIDVAAGIDAENVLRKVLGRLTPDLLPARLAVKARIMAGAVHAAIARIVGKRKALMWPDRREADDVSIGAHTAWDAFAELQQDSGRLAVGIGDLEWYAELQVPNIRKPVRRVVDPSRGGTGFDVMGDNSRGCRPDGGKACSGQKLPPADINHPLAAFHGLPPAAFVELPSDSVFG